MVVGRVIFLDAQRCNCEAAVSNPQGHQPTLPGDRLPWGQVAPFGHPQRGIVPRQ